MAQAPRKPLEAKVIPGAVEIDPISAMELETQARQEVLLEQQKLAQDAFKEAAKKRIKAELQAASGEDPEALVAIRIDLAPHADRIKIDGIDYHHGMTYNFAPQAVPTILEIMHRTWMHEAEISDTKNRTNAYRKPYDRVLTPNSL